MAAESHDRWRHLFFFFSVDQFIPRWPTKIFMLIGCRVLRKQLWCYNEGTCDIIKRITLIPHGEYLTCAKFQFFPWSGFGDTEVQNFSFFPTSATPSDQWRLQRKQRKLARANVRTDGRTTRRHDASGDFVNGGIKTIPCVRRGRVQARHTPAAPTQTPGSALEWSMTDECSLQLQTLPFSSYMSYWTQHQLLGRWSISVRKQRC